MAALNTPGLDRWRQMQQRPIGSLTNMGPPSEAQTAYKRMQQDYGQALRTLRRAGRRGDARASMAAIGLRQQAMEQGIGGVEGIRTAEDQQSGIAGFQNRLGAQARLSEQMNQRGQEALQGGQGPAQPGAATSFDKDDNGVPDMIQRPTGLGAQTPRLDSGMAGAPDYGAEGGPETTAATGRLLDQRRSLFQRMQEAGRSNLTPEMEEEARNLGVTRRGWGRGISRLGDSRFS